MSNSVITKTFTLSSITANGVGQVNLGLTEQADAGAPLTGAGMNVTVDKDEARGYAVHDTVVVTLKRG